MANSIERVENAIGDSLIFCYEWASHFSRLNVIAFIPGFVSGLMFPPAAPFCFVGFQIYAAAKSASLAKDALDPTSYHHGPRGGVYSIAVSGSGSAYRRYI